MITARRRQVFARSIVLAIVSFLAPQAMAGAGGATEPSIAISLGDAEAAPISAASVRSSTHSEAARDVLATARPALVQIIGYLGSNANKAFHGTGFAVTAGGVFMTNYHVVAQAVLHPERYRLEYRTPDGVSGKLAILALDTRHDLAVVRAEGFTPAPLEFEPVAPAKGTHAYAIGFPLDVGLTITEGVSNGKVDESFEPRIHYAGAVNAGMSGGPALSANGKVVGVNVSGYRFQQLVSFLVPAEHAIALRSRTPNSPPAPDDLKRDMREQVRAHAASLIRSFDGAIPTQVTGGFILPGKLTSFVDCSSSGKPTKEQPVETVSVNCAAKAGVFIETGMSTGDIDFQHTVLTSRRLGSWRFAHRMSAQTGLQSKYGKRRNVGPFACDNKFVKLKGFDASLSLCSRSYRDFSGLYDFAVRVTSLDPTNRGFQSELHMYGLEFEPSMSFIQRFVDAMELKP